MSLSQPDGRLAVSITGKCGIFSALLCKHVRAKIHRTMAEQGVIPDIKTLGYCELVWLMKLISVAHSDCLSRCINSLAPAVNAWESESPLHVSYCELLEI